MTVHCFTGEGVVIDGNAKTVVIEQRASVSLMVDSLPQLRFVSVRVSMTIQRDERIYLPSFVKHGLSRPGPSSEFSSALVGRLANSSCLAYSIDKDLAQSRVNMS